MWCGWVLRVLYEDGLFRHVQTNVGIHGERKTHNASLVGSVRSEVGSISNSIQTKASWHCAKWKCTVHSVRSTDISDAQNINITWENQSKIPNTGRLFLKTQLFLCGVVRACVRVIVARMIDLSWFIRYSARPDIILKTLHSYCHCVHKQIQCCVISNSHVWKMHIIAKTNSFNANLSLEVLIINNNYMTSRDQLHLQLRCHETLPCWM